MKTSYAKKSAKSTKKATAKKPAFDIAEMITGKIIEKLEAGVIPWQKPWNAVNACNYLTKRPYSGINYLLLNFEAVEQPYYLTFLQVQQMGGRVKNGAKGEIVVFWKFFKGEDEKEGAEQAGEESKRAPLIRYTKVFNVKDIEGIEFVFPKKTDPSQLERIESCEQIISLMPNAPRTQHGGNGAYYSPSGDYVNMPLLEDFKSIEGYYSVYFHELAHATGHHSRLDRKEIKEMNPFGSKEYSKEELVAEITAAFLCNHCRIENTIDNSAAYIKSWLKKLQNDKRFILDAAGKASKAAGYILGNHLQEAEQE